MDLAQRASVLAHAYIDRNPNNGLVFRPFYNGAILRTSDYRYKADFDEIFNGAQIGDEASIHALYMSDFDGELGFKITLFGRVQVFFNGEIVFKSDIFTERNNHLDNVINLKVNKGKNELLIKCTKTALGFGLIFGSHLGKWDYIFFDPQHPKCEGCCYSLNGGEWLPRYEEEKISLREDEYALFYSKDLFGRDVYIKADSFPDDEGYVNPFGVDDFGAWVGLYPLKGEVKPEFLHPVQNTYWKFKYKNVYLRPYYNSSCFGKWNYPLGVTMYGLMSIAKTLEDNSIREYVSAHMKMCVDTFDYALWDKKEHGGATSVHNLLTSMDSLDDCGAFCAALEEAKLRYNLKMGDDICDYVAEYISSRQPRTAEGAFCRQHQMHSFHNETMWLDDLYMSVPFLVRRYKLTEDMSVLNDAANQFILYEKTMRMENGLLSHVYDMRHKKKTLVAWGRGNGWAIFSLSELLMVDKCPKRERLTELFKSLAQTYIKYQSEDGRFRQVIDDETAYLETSVTAMFAAAFARGFKMNILDESYMKSAKKAVNSIAENCIDLNGNLSGVCRGSEFAFIKDYYKFDLLPRENDNHGIGIVLIAISEIL